MDHSVFLAFYKERWACNRCPTSTCQISFFSFGAI